MDPTAIETAIDDAEKNWVAARRRFVDLSDHSLPKATHRQRLYALHDAAQKYFAACGDAILSLHPRTRYSDNAGIAAHLLKEIADNYAYSAKHGRSLDITREAIEPKLTSLKALQELVSAREFRASQRLRKQFSKLGLPELGFAHGRKPATPPHSGTMLWRWFAVGCALLTVAVGMMIWAFSLDGLGEHQRQLLLWVLPLASGFCTGAFAGSIWAKARGVIPGVLISATGGCAVWLVTFLVLFSKGRRDPDPDPVVPLTVATAERLRRECWIFIESLQPSSDQVLIEAERPLVISAVVAYALPLSVEGVEIELQVNTDPVDERLWHNVATHRVTDRDGRVSLFGTIPPFSAPEISTRAVQIVAHVAVFDPVLGHNQIMATSRPLKYSSRFARNAASETITQIDVPPHETGTKRELLAGHYRITAFGHWNYSDAEGRLATTALGDPSRPSPNLLYPQGVHGQLLLSLDGQSWQPFVPSMELPVAADGWLYLKMNDNKGRYADNTGILLVSVERLRK